MLEIKNICYEAEQDGTKKQILKNVSFSVNSKNFVITGHNGSGKSTLLKIIMGIIKPTSGKVIFDGIDITDLSITERAKMGIAFAFQTPICFKGLTVKKLLQIASGEDKQDINYYCDILSKLGLCARDYIDREVNNKLSGGEQKRIEIASVIARKAKLNLFDEPEAGIDIWSFQNLLNVFNQNGSTNIIVSHQQKLMEKADEILLLSAGEVKLVGKPSEVLKDIHNVQYCQKLSGGENGQN